MTVWSSILRGAVTRFIPGILSFYGASLLLAATLKGIEIGPAQVIGFTTMGLAMTAGYVVTLGLMRPSLDEGAEIERRRSYVAGLGATCVLLGFGILHGSPTPHWMMNMFGAVAGAVTTAAMFFPWLVRSKRSDREFVEGFDSVRQVYLQSPATNADTVPSTRRDRVV